MAGVKDCPKCGLVNPPTAQRCDCGYDFVTRSAQASYMRSGAVADAYGPPSAGELAACILIPAVGLFLGLSARRQGRQVAGRRMLLISGVMFAFCNLPTLLVILAVVFKDVAAAALE